MTEAAQETGVETRGLPQPALGLAVLGAVIVASLAFVALQPWPLFRDWVSYVAVCGVPLLFVIGAFWQGGQPEGIARLAQPARGVAFVALDLVVAAVMAVLIDLAVGGGLAPPPPNAAHVAIMAVPFTFGLAVVWGGWPFRLLRNRVAGGLLLMTTAFVLAGLTYRLFANYSSFAGGPAYVAPLDPHGPLDAWLVLTFVVTWMAVALVWLHFGLWPVGPAPLRGPGLRGLALTLVIAAVAALALAAGTVIGGLTAPAFFASVTVPLLFGSIVVLNTLEGRLPLPAEQPARGVASAVLAAVIGLLLARLYVALLPVVSGDVPFGPPGYSGEVWLASAMLGVTFPLLAVVADCFGFWPLRRPQGRTGRSPRSTARV